MTDNSRRRRLFTPLITTLIFLTCEIALATDDVDEIKRHFEVLRNSIEVTSAKINSTTESTVLADLYLFRAQQKFELTRAAYLYNRTNRTLK